MPKMDFFGDVAGIEITPTEENVIEEAVGFHEIIATVRKVVKYFRFSSVKNGVPQQKIRSELGHNLELIIDAVEYLGRCCKTTKIHWGGFS
jgi:hypothetical protein